MSTKAILRRLQKKLEPLIPTDENMDVRIISAIMDKLSGDAPEGTAEAIEAGQNARTGYTFPRNKELLQLLQAGA